MNNPLRLFHYVIKLVHQIGKKHSRRFIVTVQIIFVVARNHHVNRKMREAFFHNNNIGSKQSSPFTDVDCAMQTLVIFYKEVPARIML